MPSGLFCILTFRYLSNSAGFRDLKLGEKAATVIISAKVFMSLLFKRSMIVLRRSMACGVGGVSPTELLASTSALAVTWPFSVFTTQASPTRA